MPYPSPTLLPSGATFPGSSTQTVDTTNTPVRKRSFTTDYSGVIIDQNVIREDQVNDFIFGRAYQEFKLPSLFQRSEGSTASIPALTGFHLLVAVSDAASAAIAWSLEHYLTGVGWQSFATGVTTGATLVGNETWFEVYLDDPVDILSDWLEDRFRINVTPNSSVTKLWFTVPNPLTDGAAWQNPDETVPYSKRGPGGTARPLSLQFRILAATADSGTDFLGNPYRAVATKNAISDASTLADQSASWMSGPQPSRFAVVNTYWDISDSGKPSVIDRILVDPITPNVYFSVYYSSDGDPVTNDADWDNKLWTRVPTIFQARRRETHALPQPITARYIKIEFSHLQARQYASGDFGKPIPYKKHPKWVLDYFLIKDAIDQSTSDPFIANRVAVEFDALDLAYNYYLDDLHQEPDQPLPAKDLTNVDTFLASRTDTSDSIDITTLNQIRTAFNQFQQHPAAWAKLSYLPSTYTYLVATGEIPSYPSEGLIPSLVADTSSVSSLDRDPLVLDQGFPVMFFFVTCRHAYRQLVAPLTHDRAYFAGIREIQFDREVYPTVADTTLYSETWGDFANMDRNDFIPV